jgi:adenylate kinase family enzyme
VYREETQPLEDYFDRRDLLVGVDGEGDIEAVYQRITTVLDEQVAASEA